MSDNNCDLLPFLYSIRDSIRDPPPRMALTDYMLETNREPPEWLHAIDYWKPYRSQAFKNKFTWWRQSTMHPLLENGTVPDMMFRLLDNSGSLVSSYVTYHSETIAIDALFSVALMLIDEWIQNIEISAMIDRHVLPSDTLEANNCSCGMPCDGEHTCPYREEIGNDNETMCNCCSSCTYNCAQDI